MSEAVEHRRHTLDDYLLALIAAIITGVLFWVAYTTQQTAVAVARLEVTAQATLDRVGRLERYNEQREGR